MKKIPGFLRFAAVLFCMPCVVNAAGTYYNGNFYQNPQSRYGAMSGANNNNAGGFYNTYGAGRGYGQDTMHGIGTTKPTAQQTVQQTVKKNNIANNSGKQGFLFNLGLTHEFANWDMKMKSAGSELRYDNLRWNVLDAEMAYHFGGSMPMQLKIGGRYGMQFGDSPMTDDDITAGKGWVSGYIQVGTEVEEYFAGMPALSIGTSKDGKQYGFNAAFGLTDLFKVGVFKITPSVGYRYFKHELITKNNNGLMIQVFNSSSFVNCVGVENGEIQCSPYVGFVDAGGEVATYGGLAHNSEDEFVVDADGYYLVGNENTPYISLGSTYYYEQGGTSHKYETVWAGPYIALDMEYDIDRDNIITAGFEFGLPSYESKGDQPYRVDWQHPTSVKDEGGFGDAYHFGFNAMWSSSISEKVMLTLGMTYDYYRVNGADATTYLDPQYWQDRILGPLEEDYNANVALTTEEYNEMLYLQSVRNNGWREKASGEIESVYKSMGIRLGLTAKF